MSPTICSLPVDNISRICQLVTLRDSGFHPTIRRDLVSLALTCRQLSEPAFDTLWRRLHSLAPLIRTLPEDLCTTVPYVIEHYVDNIDKGHVGTQLVFLRKPVPQDFKRFKTYSRRIRELGDEIFLRDRLSGQTMHSMPRYILISHHTIPFAVWDFLSAFGPKPLLPNLESVYHEEWDQRLGEDWRKTPFHCADLLFGPQVKTVKVCCVDPYRHPKHATELVHALSRVAKTLEHLSLEAESEYRRGTVDSPTGFLFGADVRRFSRLTRFCGRTVRVAADALVALGRLPSLKELLLHVNSAEHDWDALPRNGRGDLFPALVELTLHKVDFVWCATFLQIISSSSLRALSFRSQHYMLPPPLSLQALCSAICHHPSADSIADLFFMLGATSASASGGFIYQEHEIYWSEDFAPLFGLPAVRRLIFGGQCTVITDDTALETIAQSWPDLVELTLPWTWNAEPPPDEDRSPNDDDFPYATTWGLFHLARGCPRLTKLALAVDMRLTPHLPGTPLAHVSPVHLFGDAVSKLEEFDTTGSLLSDKARAASFLSLAFPRLSRIWEAHASSQRWWDVVDLYKAFVRVRSQERAYGRSLGKRLREPESWGSGLRPA